MAAGALSLDQVAALAIARALTKVGIPIFLALPALDAAGVWLPRGGNGGTGYWFPDRWQDTLPDPAVVDQWRPGMALCAVMGHGIDAIDVDPRNGGTASIAELHARGLTPRIIGVAATPSEGHHGLVNGLGVHSRDNFMPGVDVKAGTNGGGHGFIFLAPTVRASKVTGELTSYSWIEAPDLARLDRDDLSGAALAEAIAAQRSSATGAPQAAPAEWEAAPRFEDLDTAEQAWAKTYYDGALAGILTDARILAALPNGKSVAELGKGTHSDHPMGWEGWLAKRLMPKALQLGMTPTSAHTVEQVIAAVSAIADTLHGDDRAIWRALVAEKSQTALDFARQLGPKVLPPPRATGIALATTTPSAAVTPSSVLTADEVDLRRIAYYSDSSEAERLLVEMGGRFRFIRREGWRECQAGIWRGVDEARVIEIARRIAKREAKQAAGVDDGGKTLDAAKSRLSRGRIESAAKLARGDDAVLLSSAEAFDTHRDLLAVRNGVIDLRTGNLLAHDPAYLFTRSTSVDYRQGATHPDWTAALAALPPEVADWMQVRLGQAVSGHPTPDAVLAVLQGSGNNAKSSFMAPIMAALGDHAALLPERLLLSRPGDHPTEMTELKGLRLGVIEELPEDGVLNVKRLKDTLGTPRLSARRVYENSMQWDATHSLVQTTNYLPKVAQVDHGTWRRLALVRFPYTFTVNPSAPHERREDPSLKARLELGEQGQHEAVLAWLIEGARRWYAAGKVFPPAPQAVVDDTAAWRAETDKILAYLSERVTFTTSCHVATTDLYADFAAWLVREGSERWSERTFAARLADHELVKRAGVTKGFPLASSTASRANQQWSHAATLPPRYRAWLGVAFRGDA